MKALCTFVQGGDVHILMKHYNGDIYDVMRLIAIALKDDKTQRLQLRSRLATCLGSTYSPLKLHALLLWYHELITGFQNVLPL